MQNGVLICAGALLTAAASMCYGAQVAHLQLPEAWPVRPLMAPTDTFGLRIHSYSIDVAESEVIRWRQQQMTHCRLPPVQAMEDDWHCVTESTIYSLLRREGAFIWVQSERLQPTVGVRADTLAIAPFVPDAEILSHSENAFESSTLMRSRRALFALQRDLASSHQQQGDQLLLDEQNPAGFVQQWQAHTQRVTYTAQRDEQGNVLVLQVRGTNL